MDEDECKAEFRVSKNDLPALATALQTPDQFKCAQRTVFSGMEGLCVVLRRLAYPCRYSDHIPRFERPVPELSMISNHVIDFIYENHSHRITQWNDAILDPVSLQRYADAISNKVPLWKTASDSLMELFVLFVAQGKGSQCCTMAIRGCMPWSFKWWPFPPVSWQTCMAQ